jgi:hypothetical protein
MDHFEAKVIEVRQPSAESLTTAINAVLQEGRGWQYASTVVTGVGFGSIAFVTFTTSKIG